MCCTSRKAKGFPLCLLNETFELIGNEAIALLRWYPPEKMSMVQSGFEKRDLIGA